MRTIFRNIFLFVAVISALLLTACGGGSVDNINPVAPATQTGTLRGMVTLPTTSLRKNIDKSASDTTIIASNTIIDNAIIRASQNLKDTKVWLEDLPDILSFTDDEGNYTIENVPFGKHRVIASIIIDNEEYKWCSEVQNVINSIVKIVPQIVMQPAKISISGTVYDSVSKDAIQEVIVEVWGQKSTTDANGKYTVFNMPAGTWDVTYSKNGYQTITTPMSFAEGNETSGNFYLVPVGNNVPNTASDSSSVVLKELIPAYNANSVSIQTTISAFFNGAKINPNYAKINFTSGNPRNVGGSFAFINDYVVYTHNEEWPVNTKIAGSISNLKDYLGKDIASFSFEFTTTANVVKSISPANNATKVEVNTPIEITFNAKMNTNQNLLDLVKVIDDRGNSVITDSKQFSWKSASNGDILTINNISLQPSNTYVVQLSENLLDKDGSKLFGNRMFSFSTRGAVYLQFEPSSISKKSDLIFFIYGDGSIADISKGDVSLSCEEVKGKLTINNNCIVFKLEEGQKWPVGKNVTGKISGLKDRYNIDINQQEFTFYVNYFEGEGTIEKPYLIQDADDLNNLRYVSDKGYYFKQTQDIDLTAYGTSYGNGKGWLPIENLNGYYDGDNRKITNLFMDRPKETVGLFNSIQGSVENLGIEVSINGIKGGGGATLANSFNGIINNCWVGGSGKILCTGGCSALIAIKYGKIDNCYSTIDVEGYGEVGGLISTAFDQVTNCYSSGNVKNNDDNGITGGLIAYAHGKISECHSSSIVKGGCVVGGLIGASYTNVEKCYSTGETTGCDKQSFVGGLVGSFLGDKKLIIYCYSTGNVKSGADSGCVGGLIGEILAGATVKNCYSTGNISSGKKQQGAGGFSGIIQGDCKVINCYSTGNVSGNLGAGGFVSHIVGKYSFLINCYSTGNVSGDERVGGFAGGNIDGTDTVFRNCYSDCLNVNNTNDEDINRIIGYNNPQESITFINCYANKNMKLIKNGVTTQPGLQNPLPSTVALDGVDGANLPDNPDWKNEIFKDGYEEGTSFDDIWEIGTSGLPILKNMPGSPLQ